MAWSTLGRDGYALWLTDGYIGTALGAQQCESPTRENALAARLHHLTLYTRSGARRLNAPQTVHYFVIGSPGWTHREHTELQQISEGDQHNHYRIIIMGASCDPHRPFFGYWSDWLRLAGLSAKKRHHDTGGFRVASQSLLEQLHAEHMDSRKPPLVALGRLGVPFSYRGGADHRRDDSLSSRIQQYGINPRGT